MDNLLRGSNSPLQLLRRPPQDVEHLADHLPVHGDHGVDGPLHQHPPRGGTAIAVLAHTMNPVLTLPQGAIGSG